ncbi:MAG TPA: hypothetical protein VIS74_04305 [Chthoniobacterales bacterium]
MTTAPRAFVRRLNSHNRHALLGALLSFVASAGVWTGLFWGGQVLIVLALSSIQGPAARLPVAYFWIFCGGVAVLLTLAAIDRTLNPFPRPDDRPIIGWHILKQLALLPALLTFAIYDNLNAYRRLSPEVAGQAWALLTGIYRARKLPYHELGRLGLEASQAEGLLLLLQFAGYVDLHHGREEWFYLVRSSEEESLKLLAEGN